MISEEYEDYTITNDVGNRAGMLIIKAAKGPTPNYLAGSFTSMTKAKQAIDEYKRSKMPRMSKAANG